MGRYNRVDLKTRGHREEIELTAIASPGMAINEVDGSVTFTQGEKTAVHIACEDALQGRTVDDAYASGDVAFTLEPDDGDVVAVLLKDGEIVVKGDKLIVDVDGVWIKTTGTPASEPLEAMEDLSPQGANALIKAKRI